MKNIDKKFMNLAIKEAIGKNVFPNPLVGAVLIKNGKIISKGSHDFFGDNHAEINAIKNSQSNTKDSTLYVTLEPCNHHGKTPPCTDAIIKSKIKKVVIAHKDPNPKVSGLGIKKLKENNIEVVENILKEKAKNINKNYLDLIQRKNKQKTNITLKMAMTLDGKIATKTGDSKWISSKKTRNFIHKFRTNFDGILVGINTVLKDNPILSSHNKGKNPARIIIDPNLKIKKYSNVLDGLIPTIIFYSNENKKLNYISKLKNVVLIKIKTINKIIDFKQIIKKLKNMMILNVLIEGGGETAFQALNAKIVDNILFTISPKIIGGRNSKTSVEGIGISKISNAFKVKNIKIKKIANDIIIQAKVKK